VTDPPTVLQNELLLLGELEGLVAALPDANARVSARMSELLQQLRDQLVVHRPSQRRQFDVVLARELLRVLAAEVVKRVLETLISNQVALRTVRAREQGYDDRGRVHQIASRRRWAQAA
jgi:hypothetical protein